MLTTRAKETIGVLNVSKRKIKILLVMLVAMFSISMLCDISFATDFYSNPGGIEQNWLAMEPLYKRTGDDGYTTYEMIFKRLDDSEYGLEEFRLAQTSGVEVLYWQLFDDNKKILIVLKVEASVEEIEMMQNEYGDPAGTYRLVPGYTTFYDVYQDVDFVEHNDEPTLEWAYKNETDTKYVQFKVTDEARIGKVIDGYDKERVDIEAKDFPEILKAKYEFYDGEDVFYVCDLLGNKLEINIDEIPVTYTIAAKDIDGQTVVLNMKLPEEAALIDITTVDEVNITDDADVEFIGKGEDSDDFLVAIYKQRSGLEENNIEGTTFVNVKYELDGDTYIIPVELELDLDLPVVVKRNITDDGSVTDGNSGVYRAYKNSDSTKALVEIYDVGSGISRIAACTGANINSLVEGNGTNQAFDIVDLPQKLVQLINLPEGATYIKVVDGIGNIRFINLNNENEIKDINNNDSITTNDAGLTINMVKDGNGQETIVTATYRDNKVGLKKFVKAKDVETALATNVTSANKISDGNVSYVIEGGDEYTPLRKTDEIDKWYKVTETTTTLSGTQLQGTPEYYIVDAFDNVEEFNLNNILYKCDYIYVNDDGTGTSSAITLKVHDDRRIKKVKAVINGNPVTLELFETTSHGEGPVDLSKVYDIGSGEVESVTIYHYNGANCDSYTQNIELFPDVEQEEETEAINNAYIRRRITSDDELRAKHVKLREQVDPDDEELQTNIYDIKIDYGIRRLRYSDGCLLEFHADLPTILNVYAMDKDGEALSVEVTDALGYTYTLTHDGEDLDTYAWA